MGADEGNLSWPIFHPRGGKFNKFKFGNGCASCYQQLQMNAA